MDEAEVIEHFVAGEAAMVVGSAGDSRVAGLAALSGPGIGIPTLTPRIKALALGLETAPLAAIPSGGENDVGGAEVVGEEGIELDDGRDAGLFLDGVDGGAELVTVEGFLEDGGGTASGLGAEDFPLITAEIEGGESGGAAADVGSQEILFPTRAGGIELEGGGADGGAILLGGGDAGEALIAVALGGIEGLEQRGAELGDLLELAEGGPLVAALAIGNDAPSGIVSVTSGEAADGGGGDGMGAGAAVADAA